MPGVRAYHRVDPLTDEQKAHYTPAQFGAFMKVQLMAGRQAQRGRFRSIAALRAALPAMYARHVDFLIEEEDVVEQPDGTAYMPGWDEWQEGDLTVAERMRRLRERQRQGADERNADRNGGRNGGVTRPYQTVNAESDSLSGSTTSSVGVDSPPSPPPSGGVRGSRRANGTSPRQVAKRAQQQEQRERDERAQRARRRQLARSDGQISEAEYSELTERDADPPVGRPRGYAYSSNGRHRDDVDDLFGSTSKEPSEVSS